ncbi:MAG: Uma2 family endonuclease [Spirochaetaceae bacterium]|nr:MAG: Uma2 family endonuclease [Spirochaetaceae bacterium]
MAIPKGDKDGLFTYKDYLSWPEDERWELINGVAYNMSPAPVRRHQGILSELSVEFGIHFRDRSCNVYIAPFDVLLPDRIHSASDEESDTVVQPDLVVVCDSAKLTRQGCTGAPDFVLEILSPATAFKDMEDKLRLYERHGVREYWIINPGNDTLLVYSVLPADTRDSATVAVGATAGVSAPEQGNTYQKPVLYTEGDTVSPRIFPDLSIDLSRVFDRDR